MSKYHKLVFVATASRNILKIADWLEISIGRSDWWRMPSNQNHLKILKSLYCMEMDYDCVAKNISGSGFFLQQFQELSLVDQNLVDSADDTLVKSFGILLSTYIIHFVILITFLILKK